MSDKDNTLDRISNLLAKAKITQKEFVEQLELGLNPNAFSDWKLGRSSSYKKHITEIADYFNVSADYLLCKTDNPEPYSPEAIVPENLKEAWSAFRRGEFEGLTQEEIDALAVIAKTLKNQRK